MCRWTVTGLETEVTDNLQEGIAEVGSERENLFGGGPLHESEECTNTLAYS
jgi:hypothetical protein